MGAIAGSSILGCERTQNLDTVTLTINNSCNLKCPHCYLQYEPGRDEPFDIRIFGLLQRSTFRHLAIVGKEPLLDRGSIDLCMKLAEICQSTGRSASLISNGLNINMAPSDFANRFSFIDISLDGGPESYRRYRKGSTQKLAKGLEILTRSQTQLNALHVLNSETIGHIDDMLMARSWAPFSRIVFSPYLKTENHGLNPVGGLTLASVLQSLSRARFRETEGAVLLVHDQHLRDGGMSRRDFLSLATQLGILDHIRLIAGDPIEYGIIRVTYDGLVLAPYVALHPRHYRTDKRSNVAELEVGNLNDAFWELAPSTTMVQ